MKEDRIHGEREKNKKPHSYPDIVFSHLVASLPLLYLIVNIAFNIWLSF